MSIIETACMRGFTRLCNDGWLQGWHERNGGNLTYRMTAEEVAECAPEFNEPGPWVNMGVTGANLAGEFFITTGSGKFMRNATLEPQDACGIVEINEAGDSWRIVWGLENGGKPTSEFPSHFMNHSVRVAKTDGACRVIYHAHTPNVIALSTLVAPSAREYSRILWKSMTECIVVFPDGVGVVPWMVPGGADIANATCALMEDYEAAVWCQHGLFCSGATFDITFGLMHTIEKSAQLYLMARSANAGAEPNFLISDDQLRAVCRDFGIAPNEDFLD